MASIATIANMAIMGYGYNMANCMYNEKALKMQMDSEESFYKIQN
jgi:hypothetical protein